MPEINLPIFPDGSVASTVTTTVWIGVIVVVWMNLRFGWTLSGLVVPGYLVPLMFIRPVSVLVILVESMATYGIIKGICELFLRTKVASGLFGRDRFFGIVLTSVLVRVIGDGYLLPWFGAWTHDAWGWNWNYEDQLHSVGLVVVALIANYFWKPGIVRGIGPLAASIGVTFVIVKYVLVPYTTFDIANLRYVYEDIASSLLASPKAYMVLLTTAYLASRMNLRYSWEYNGILIPSLIALQFCEPLKIVTTFVESLVVLCVSSSLLKTRWLRGINMQGGRKLAFFFTTAFVFRLSLAWLAVLVIPEWKVSDLHGFGYLLSTLLANRLHERGHGLRIGMATMQVAVVGSVLGSLLGFGMLYLPDYWDQYLFASTRPLQENPLPEATLVDAFRADKLRLFESRGKRQSQGSSPSDLAAFRRCLRLLVESPDAFSDRIAQASPRLWHLGWDIQLIESRYAYVRDLDVTRGRGLFVVDLEQPHGTLISVPHPLREPYTMEAGLNLLQNLPGSSLAVAGVAPLASQEPRSLSEDRTRSYFEAFHQQLGMHRTLQLRGYSLNNLPKIVHERLARDATETISDSDLQTRLSNWMDHGDGQLFVTGGVPDGCDLSALERLVGPFEVHWDALERADKIQDLTKPCFGTLYLSRRTKTSLFTGLIVPPGKVSKPSLDRESGSIVRWIRQQKEKIVRAGSEAYVAARPEEIILLDQEVLRPLMEIVREGEAGRQEEDKLSAIRAAAGAMGYRLLFWEDPERKTCYWILEESEPRRRNWGTYVFAEAFDSPVIWEVPRPLLEVHSLEFALQHFANSRAMAMLIPGAHVRANRDRSADVTWYANKFTMFNAVHQALLQAWSGTPSVIAQARAIKDPVEADVVLATDDGKKSLGEFSEVLQQLVAPWEAAGWCIELVDAHDAYAGYELSASAQWLSMRQADDIDFVAVWISNGLRTQFRDQASHQQLHAQLDALAIPYVSNDAIAYLGRLSTHQWNSSHEQHEFWTCIENYLRSRDIVWLLRLQEAGSRLEWMTDAETGQAMLLVYGDDQCWPWIVKLAETTQYEIQRTIIRDARAASLRHGLDSSCSVLWIQRGAE